MTLTLRQQLRSLSLPILLCAAIWCLGMSSSLTEHFYSRGTYPWISSILRWCSARLPFPLGDFLYLILLLWLCLSIFRFCRKIWLAKREKSLIMNGAFSFLKLTLWLYIAFKLLWGLNYSRPSIATNLGISKQGYSAAQLTSLAEQLIQETNRTAVAMQQQKARRNYNLSELQKGAEIAYGKLADRNELFSYKNPVLKAVLSSNIITKIGLEGYYCPLSGEANINMALPAVSLPFVSCHEIGHQLGIAREDEANLAGYLACLNSPDLNFRYAGLYSILWNVLFEVRLIAPDQIENLQKQINPLIQADYQAEREFWLKHNSDMSAYMGTALDQFLKINNQNKGIASYQDIVIWVYNLQLQGNPNLFPAFENSTSFRQKNQ